MTDYCENVDCNEIAVIDVGVENKHVCLKHAIQYQKDLAERMSRNSDIV